ncbi:hypothetical protein K469DRAFT_729262 [Zopfia rhizophila CBS 207.26]|uniref:Nuclease PA3 n=1 Tax=Zopfia rhizophila CBS 207.26 TaxID=1314779 RepID=A0A6A6DRN9_9PEZI|nr:hypothetical protein K469DRAFT_729262 [Zopfia rhizophila CBS 207.26]
MSLSKSLLLSLAPLLPQVSAWGTLGHTTVAFVAQNFVSDRTKSFTQGILNDSSSAYLANVATWADSYRSTAGGSFSSPFHYIDANDSPPSSCGVDYERDCSEEGCIVSAISNYTSRVQTTYLPLTERQKALKWIIHFVGDIHQPLHTEALEVGGNLINVTFNGTGTNLHRIWDTNMPEKLIGGFAVGDARDWATTLTSEIMNGSFAKDAKGWLNGMDVNDGIASAMYWAIDSNAFVCSTVVPKGADAVRDQELSGEYYETAIPVIQMQIAKAGYRLAAWLNLVATMENGLGTGKKRGKGNGLERRMVNWDEKAILEARRVRKTFGSDCGCGDEH